MSWEYPILWDIRAFLGLVNNAIIRTILETSDSGVLGQSKGTFECPGKANGKVEVNMQLYFGLKKWSAFAPGIQSVEDWNQWLKAPDFAFQELNSQVLKPVPPLLRRRLGLTGKLGVGAILELGDLNGIPSIFASRHGDTALTYELLEGISNNAPMSPAKFSMAVHNGIGGIYTILRKNKSRLTALAASEGLILTALLEAIGQLESCREVLVVVYDTPLPELYRETVPGPEMGFGLAMLLTQSTQQRISLQRIEGSVSKDLSCSAELTEFRDCLSLLTGQVTEVKLQQGGMAWQFSVA